MSSVWLARSWVAISRSRPSFGSAVITSMSPPSDPDSAPCRSCCCLGFPKHRVANPVAALFDTMWDSVSFCLFWIALLKRDLWEDNNIHQPLSHFSTPIRVDVLCSCLFCSSGSTRLGSIPAAMQVEKRHQRHRFLVPNATEHSPEPLHLEPSNSPAELRTKFPL